MTSDAEEPTVSHTIIFPRNISNMELAYLALDNNVKVTFGWDQYDDTDQVSITGPDAEAFVALFHAARSEERRVG